MTLAGCTDDASATVTVYNPGTVNAGNDTTIMAGMSIQLNASGGTSWTWSPGTGLSCTDCKNPVATLQQTTIYYVTATDANGCRSTDNIMITVITDCGSVYIGNIISPNDDLINDVIYVHNPCIMTMEWIIYDRWGEKIFTLNDPGRGWDGKHDGKPVDAGVYFYYLKATLYNSTEVKKKGNITVVR